MQKIAIAEAYVTNKDNSSTKKRKNESNNVGKNKKINSLFKPQDNGKVITVKEDPKNLLSKNLAKAGSSKEVIETISTNTDMRNADQNVIQSTTRT